MRPFIQVHPAGPQRETHREQVVHRMLDWICTRYGHPLRLGALAKEIG